MVEEKVDDGNLEQAPMEQHPFYKNRRLKLFILFLTLAVFLIPIIMIANVIAGKPAFFFF
ncbi:hypothetical protein ACOBQJ_08870 [Pelotomaculum propionicicum]|uniref:hypothetical protein n=1 Tax=Pelotomaculum propionicicum TaxID=258475 RepID=UPI003B80C421